MRIGSQKGYNVKGKEYARLSLIFYRAGLTAHRWVGYISSRKQRVPEPFRTAPKAANWAALQTATKETRGTWQLISSRRCMTAFWSSDSKRARPFAVASSSP